MTVVTEITSIDALAAVSALSVLLCPTLDAALGLTSGALSWVASGSFGPTFPTPDGEDLGAGVGTTDDDEACWVGTAADALVPQPYTRHTADKVWRKGLTLCNTMVSIRRPLSVWGRASVRYRPVMTTRFLNQAAPRPSPPPGPGERSACRRGGSARICTPASEFQSPAGRSGMAITAPRSSRPLMTS